MVDGVGEGGLYLEVWLGWLGVIRVKGGFELVQSLLQAGPSRVVLREGSDSVVLDLLTAHLRLTLANLALE